MPAGRKSRNGYLPNLKFIFKCTTTYGEIIFTAKLSAVKTFMHITVIKNVFILSYNKGYKWIPIYIYNKFNKDFTCEKNARYYYDSSTKEIGILNNKYHTLDILTTVSEIDCKLSTVNQLGKILYFFYYTYPLFEIRYSSKSTNKSIGKGTRSLYLIDNYINDIKLLNRHEIKLFINNIKVDIRKYIELYNAFCIDGIEHDILLDMVFNSLLFLNIDTFRKYHYNSIIYNQLFGIDYNSKFKHFNVFTLNDKSKVYTYYKVAIKNESDLNNLVVYTNNYLLRLTDVRE